MNQVERVQHLLSYHYPVFSVPDLDDIAIVCGVDYKLVATFISLTRLKKQDIHAEMVEFVKRHRPDILLQLPQAAIEDYSGSINHHFQCY